MSNGWTRRRALAAGTVVIGLGGIATLSASRPPKGVFSTAPFTAGVALWALQGTPGVLPGGIGREVYPFTDAHLTYYAANGARHVRIEAIWERLQPRLFGPLGEQPLDGEGSNRNPLVLLMDLLDSAHRHGLKAVLDLCHNYGRRRIGYDGDWSAAREVEVGSKDCPPLAFADYCSRIVMQFGQHPAIAAIELMNEPHDQESGEAGYVSLCQAAIDAIRSVDKEIVIAINGYGWASANYWQDRNPTLHTLHDHSRRILWCAHQYFDADESGRYAGQEASAPAVDDPSVGARRIASFVAWLKRHDYSDCGVVNEFGAPDTPAWNRIVEGFVTAARDAGLGLTAHAGSPYPDDPYLMNLYRAPGRPVPAALKLMKDSDR